MNWKKFLCLPIISCLLIGSIPVFGQENVKSPPLMPKPTLSQHLFKINILNPGLGFEQRLTPKISLNLETGISFSGAMTSEGDNEITLYFSMLGYAQLDGRYYYNLSKRLSQGKNISHNSGNYFGAHFRYNFGRISGVRSNQNDMHGLIYGIDWGLQRSYGHFYLNLKLGANINVVGSSHSTLYPDIGIRIGFLIFKQK